MNTDSAENPSLHYGWVIIALGFLVIFNALGLARFAYGVFLPGMQSGLGLSYERLGFIGTSNFAGYLCAVIVTPFLIRRFQHRAAISAGLLLISLCMFGISRSSNFVMILMLFTLVGMGSGFANVSMMVLLPHWFRSRQRGKAAGIICGGSGLGIIISGFLIPYLNRTLGADGWRSGWLIFSIIALVIAAGAALFLRNSPAEMGLEPMGEAVPVTAGPFTPHDDSGKGSLLLRLGILYLLFGITFMVYGTFIVATMIKEFGFSEAKAGIYWSWVGFFSVFSGVVFGTISDRVGRKKGLALVFLVQAAANILVGFNCGTAGIVVSIILFGLAFFAVPAIMAATVGDYLGVSGAANAFVMITIFFAIGQTLGPGSAGLIAGMTGTFTTTYLLSALLTVSAAVLAMSLPAPPEAP
ncbi:MAG: YbfB/YjiJ family MFS transporter [Desulfuromonadaceae bacterium]